MLSLDELFIHRTNMIAQSGFEFIGIYLGCWGVQWASTMAGKRTPRCKGAAKTDQSGKTTSARACRHFVACATHSTCHFVEHKRVTDDSRPCEFFSSLANVHVRAHKGFMCWNTAIFSASVKFSTCYPAWNCLLFLSEYFILWCLRHITSPLAVFSVLTTV